MKIGRAMCSLEPLIGQYYGIQFALAADGQTLEFKRPKMERWATHASCSCADPSHVAWLFVLCAKSISSPCHGLSRDDGTQKDEWHANGTMDKNNSELLDRGDAHQNLKPADIEAMREAGMGGEAIVKALLANSETYESKTQFAQVLPCIRITQNGPLSTEQDNALTVQLSYLMSVPLPCRVSAC